MRRAVEHYRVLASGAWASYLVGTPGPVSGKRRYAERPFMAGQHAQAPLPEFLRHTFRAVILADGKRIFSFLFHCKKERPVAVGTNGALFIVCP